MGEIMREAQFSLAEANFAAGDFRCDFFTLFCIVLKSPDNNRTGMICNSVIF